MKMQKRLKFLSAVAIFFSSTSLSAQDDIGNLFNEEIAESKVLIKEYISPFMKSSSLALNQGWYNTAKVHKFPGFDLTTSISLMGIPDSETFFKVSDLGLKHYSLDENASPDGEFAPTVFGPDRTPKFIYKKGTPDEEAFDGHPGIGMKDEIGRNFMPVPIAHLGIGLPKNTEIKIRFVPTIGLGDEGEFKIFGVGVMHDIKQHIPGIKLLPFDLSAFAGYTRMSVEYRPEQQDVQGENQRAEMTMNATTIQGVISKQFSVITFYGSIGYNIAKSNIGFKGTYDINDDGDTTDSYERDPIDLSFSASGPRASAGFRLKLAVITIHADYTFQKYKALNVGFGISVR